MVHKERRYGLLTVNDHCLVLPVDGAILELPELWDFGTYVALAS